jgi:hypothetical protein
MIGDKLISVYALFPLIEQSSNRKLVFNLLILSFEDGFKSLHPVNIFMRCERNVSLFRNNFKHIGDRQFLEILGESSK